MEQTTSRLIGTTLGSCTLEKLIGQGGMGAVYLARQARPQRYVAVKVLFPNMVMSNEVYQEFLLRFRREADLIAKLEHINIMPIYEYGEQHGLAYLVMPHLPGGTLRDVLQHNGALTLQEAVTFTDQAAAALDYAHAHGVIHRDIKPGNFLLHSDGRLVLADFGIARGIQTNTNKAGATLTSSGTLLGTPEYMAPEMVHGLPIDRRADVYELGVVLFQMLTGRVPFQGNTPLAVAIKHLHEPLPQVHQLNPNIPAAVDQVLRKATAKKPDERYASTGALAQDLRRAIASPTHSSAFDLGYMPTLHSPLLSDAVPAVVTQYETPPARDVLNTGYTVLPNYIVPSYHEPFLLQNNVPSTQQIKKRSPWLPLFAVCLLLAIAAGTFLGLHYKPSRAITPPAGPTAVSTVIRQTTYPTPRATATAIVQTPVVLTPTQQAHATVEQYFMDINNKDYRSAYNQWGSGYQSSTDYDTFKNGFSNTQHDDVTFGDIIEQSDGTFYVHVTFNATKTNSDGSTIITTYQGYYDVGLENNVMKLLSANIGCLSNCS